MSFDLLTGAAINNAANLSISVSLGQPYGASLAVSQNVSQQLQLYVHDRPTLEAAGYVQTPLSRWELEMNLRCMQCQKSENHYLQVPAIFSLTNAEMSQLRKASQLAEKRSDRNGTKEFDKQNSSGTISHATANGGLRENRVMTSQKPAHGQADIAPKRPLAVCKFHTGQTFYAGPRGRVWSCCRGEFKATPCRTALNHVFPNLTPDFLGASFQYFETPNAELIDTKRAAVAIDCEMGMTSTGDSELIRISLVDADNREVLIDHLVSPNNPVTNWVTRITGITAVKMTKAIVRGEAILGRDAARNAVFQYVGPNTIVIGHGAVGDFASLKWIHYKVVDTLLLAKKFDRVLENQEASSEEPQQGQGQGEQKADGEGEKKNAKKPTLFPAKSLKCLSKQVLQREIQKAGDPHDSVEDAVAALDLAIAFASGRFEKA